MAEQPQRMCVVCRTMKDKQDLVRIVKNKEGNVFIDETFKQNGRGAYLCKNEECVKKCVKTKALNRAFKCPIDENVYAKIMEVTLER